MPDGHPDDASPATETTSVKSAAPGRLRGFVWPSWEHRKRMVRREAWFVALAAYPLIALAYLLPSRWRDESPAVVALEWAAFMIRVFQFHAGLLLLAIVALAAWRRRWRLALVALPPMLFTLLPAATQFLPRRPAATQAVAGGPAMRVMTANLLMVNTDTDGILGEVIAANPDVLLLQEYTAGWDAAVRKALAATFPYDTVVMRDDSFGIAIYSKTPFIGDVDQRYPLGRAGVEQMRAEIDVRGRRVALYNVHFLPPRTLQYFGEHRLQLADLLDTLKAEKLPYIICGDFNFPETTAQHRELQRVGAREAHEMAGTGRGATWPVNSVFRYVIPGVRIDHVYLGPQFVATACAPGVGRGSDHRPVVVDVAFAAN